MTRNVLNTWDVERFLGALPRPDENPAIERWLDRVAGRWILKEFPAVGRVVRAQSQADEVLGVVDVLWPGRADSSGETSHVSPIPDWLDAALPRKVYWLDMAGRSAQDLAGRLDAVLAYFRELAGSPQFGRLDRISLPDAITLAIRFRARHESQEENAYRAAHGHGNTLMTFDNGFRIALLTTAEDLAYEGECMRNCVGDYADRIGHDREILSLRDAADRPHVTIEVREGRRVHEIHGKANGPVSERYRPYMRDFFKAMGLNLGRKNAAAGDQRTRIDEIETAIAAMPEEVWSLYVDLFRGPNGLLVWLEPIHGYEIAAERFDVCQVRFPSHLFCSARAQRTPRGRELKKQILNDLGTVVVGFCQRDDATLVVPNGSEQLLGFDLRRLRHTHMERLRRRLAQARRTMKNAARESRQPEALLAQWEGDRRQLAYRLNEEPLNYL